MEFLLYCIPGVPVPLSTILIFAVGAVLTVCVRSVKVKSVILAAAVIIGSLLALAGDADKLLLAAMIFVLIAVSLVFPDEIGPGRGAPRGRRRR